MRPPPPNDQPDGLDVIVDLGATNFRVGLASSRLEPPALVRSTPTTKDEILDHLCEAINDIKKLYRGHLSSVTVGCPGLVNDSGVVLKSLYLPLKDCDLATYLSERLNVVLTRVINDAKAQAFGLRDKYISTFYVVLGTGVGGAIVDRRRLVLGVHSFAGEVGHIQIGSNNKDCVCGRQGCLDTYASGFALAKELGEGWFQQKLTIRADEALYSAGYHVSRAAMFGKDLLDPEAVVIAGHITAHQSFQFGFSAGWKKHELGNVRLVFLEHTWPLASRGLTFLRRRTKTND